MQVALDFAQQVALIKAAMRQHHPGFGLKGRRRDTEALASCSEADISSALKKHNPALSTARFKELMDVWRRTKISRQSALKVAESEGRDERGKSIRMKRLMTMSGHNEAGQAIHAVELGRMVANSEGRDALGRSKLLMRVSRLAMETEGRDERGRSNLMTRIGRASAASVKSKLAKAEVCSALCAEP